MELHDKFCPKGADGQHWDMHCWCKEIAEIRLEAWYEGYEARGRMEQINNEDTHDGPYREAHK